MKALEPLINDFIAAAYLGDANSTDTVLSYTAAAHRGPRASPAVFGGWSVGHVRQRRHGLCTNILRIETEPIYTQV